jgi:hypothetical protein
MKQLIHCDQFYQDVNSLESLISSLEFEDTLYGKEILGFSYIPQGLTEFIGSVLDDTIEIQPDTGLFRKPNTTIHFDPFYQHARWSCIVAVEDTVLNLHTHQSGVETFFDVQDRIDDFFIQESTKPQHWTTTTTLTLKQNQFVFIRPWVWRSLAADRLVQTFLLNLKIGQ